MKVLVVEDEAKVLKFLEKGLNSSEIAADTAVRLAPGARVLATANGQAVVEFDGGCRVKVEAGQRFTIRADACLAQPDRSMRFAEVSPAR